MSCIDPYTASQTYGVSYNGGYKPDPNIKWIAADDNSVPMSGPDPMPPMIFSPGAPAYFQTVEARRFDPREGGVPIRDIQFDDPMEHEPQVEQTPIMPGKDKDLDDSLTVKIGLSVLLVLLVIFLATRS
jgi:hypothetical protein